MAGVPYDGTDPQYKVKNIELLGFKGMVKWTQDKTGLTVQMPEQNPCDHATALKSIVAWSIDAWQRQTLAGRSGLPQVCRGRSPPGCGS